MADSAAPRPQTSRFLLKRKELSAFSFTYQWLTSHFHCPIFQIFTLLWRLAYLCLTRIILFGALFYFNNFLSGISGHFKASFISSQWRKWVLSYTKLGTKITTWESRVLQDSLKLRISKSRMTSIDSGIEAECESNDCTDHTSGSHNNSMSVVPFTSGSSEPQFSFMQDTLCCASNIMAQPSTSTSTATPESFHSVFEIDYPQIVSIIPHFQRWTI